MCMHSYLEPVISHIRGYTLEQAHLVEYQLNRILMNSQTLIINN